MKRAKHIVRPRLDYVSGESTASGRDEPFTLGHRVALRPDATSVTIGCWRGWQGPRRLFVVSGRRWPTNGS